MSAETLQLLHWAATDGVAAFAGERSGVEREAAMSALGTMAQFLHDEAERSLGPCPGCSHSTQDGSTGSFQRLVSSL